MLRNQFIIPLITFCLLFLSGCIGPSALDVAKAGLAATPSVFLVSTLTMFMIFRNKGTYSEIPYLSLIGFVLLAASLGGLSLVHEAFGLLLIVSPSVIVVTALVGLAFRNNSFLKGVPVFITILFIFSCLLYLTGDHPFLVLPTLFWGGIGMAVAFMLMIIFA